MNVTVMLDDDSAVVMPYDDAMRLWLRLRWALDRAHKLDSSTEVG